MPPRNQTIQAITIADQRNKPQRCRNPAGASPESLTRNGPTKNNTHTVTRRRISGTISEAVLRICSIVSGTITTSESWDLEFVTSELECRSGVAELSATRFATPRQGISLEYARHTASTSGRIKSNSGCGITPIHKHSAQIGTTATSSRKLIS